MSSRLVHNAHPAAADQPLDAVLAEHRTWRERRFLFDLDWFLLDLDCGAGQEVARIRRRLEGSADGGLDVVVFVGRIDEGVARGLRLFEGEREQPIDPIVAVAHVREVGWGAGSDD